jgi:hypothetical protein
MDNIMCIPTRDEIRAAYWQGEEATIQLFDYLVWELQALQDQARTRTAKTAASPIPARASKRHPAPKARGSPGNKKSGEPDDDQLGRHS